MIRINSYSIIFFTFTFLLLVSCTNIKQQAQSDVKVDITGFYLNEQKIHTTSLCLTASAGDNVQKIRYKSLTTIERISMEVEFIPISDNITIRIGKEYTSVCEIRNDSLFVYIGDPQDKEQIFFDKEILPAPLKKGSVYKLICNKSSENALSFSLISDSLNITKKYSIGDLPYPEYVIAFAPGLPFLDLNDGTIELKSLNLKSDYQKPAKVSIFGDSFIEGNSMVTTGLEYRWCALLANDIGKDFCPIVGQGGIRICQNINRYIKVYNSWYNSPYVIIALGTNNYSFFEYKYYMRNFISLLKSRGQTPILVTITPYINGDYTTTESINQWVKNSGELYIDMHKAVTEPSDGSKWRPGYEQGDGSHPSKLGHKAMYEQIKIDCPFLFDL